MGALLKEKATSFEMMNFSDFRASQAWLNKFKKRYGICTKVMAGEADSVTDDTVNR